MADIEAEIAVADERSQRSDAEDRADAAATVLRWLIGADDHLPIRAKDRGELVGGKDGVIRSADQLVRLARLARDGYRTAIERSRDVSADADSRLVAEQDANYLRGVCRTLGWAFGQESARPVTGLRSADVTTRAMKAERLRARDVSRQVARSWTDGRLPPAGYGEGVEASIDWLLGDTLVQPVSPVGSRPRILGA